MSSKKSVGGRKASNALLKWSLGEKMLKKCIKKKLVEIANLKGNIAKIDAELVAWNDIFKEYEKDKVSTTTAAPGSAIIIKSASAVDDFKAPLNIKGIAKEKYKSNTKNASPHGNVKLEDNEESTNIENLIMKISLKKSEGDDATK